MKSTLLNNEIYVLALYLAFKSCLVVLINTLSNIPLWYNKKENTKLEFRGVLMLKKILALIICLFLMINIGFAVKSSDANIHWVENDMDLLGN